MIFYFLPGPTRLDSTKTEDSLARTLEQRTLSLTTVPQTARTKTLLGWPKTSLINSRANQPDSGYSLTT